MSEAEKKFDPYHEWLGIPEWDRPVNAYRLLGIETFEENRTVIEAAANRQMAYLQELSSGDDHIEEAQKLLGQVSRARVVLLNPEKKAAYDRKLTAQLDSLPEATADAGKSTPTVPKTKAIAAPATKSKVADLIKLGILGVVILVAIGIFLFKDPYLKIHVIDENGQPIQAEVPFTELTPAKADKKKLFIHSLSNGNPAEWLFDEMENDVNNIRIHNYADWPNSEYHYEIVGPSEQTFDRSRLYLSTPSITFTLRTVEPIQIEGKLKGDFKGRNIAVFLDTSGNEVASDIGTEIDATPTNRFIYLKIKEKGKFELEKAYLRTTDNPSIKVIERTGRTYKLIGTQSIDQHSNDVNDLAVKIKKSEAPAATETTVKAVNALRAVKIRGEFFILDDKGEKQPLKETIPIFFDLDGDGEHMKNGEDFTYSKEDGTFRIFLRKPPPDTESVHIELETIPNYIEDPGSIPFPWDKVTDDGGVSKLKLNIELQRRQITLSGAVKVDSEEESAEGFVIFLDRNNNGEPDADEPKTTTGADGNYSMPFPFFPNDFSKVIEGKKYRDVDSVSAAAPANAHGFTVKQNGDHPNIEDYPEAIRELNFTATKQQDIDIALSGEATPTNSENAEPGGNNAAGILATPEDDPEGFLRRLGFSGNLPDEGSEEEPVWAFQNNDELTSQFTTAKRAYDRAAKRQNWNKIEELEAARKNNDTRIEDILTNAKTEIAKTRAQQKVAPYNEANNKIDAELQPLKENRDALLGELLMAAEAVELQQQQYQAALDAAEGVKKAAADLGISIESLSEKQQAAWQPAIEFIAQRELARLGLQKQGRKWMPTGVAIEAAGLQQIKVFAQQHFQDYVRKKDKLTALISQNQSSMQSQIDKLEKELDYQTRAPRYKNAKKEFDRMTKIYLEHLATLQTQRAEIESKKEAIEKILGGAKKYKAVINQYPKDEVIFKKQEFIGNLQQMVQ